MVLYSSKLSEPVIISTQPGDPKPPTPRKRKSKTKEPQTSELQPPASDLQPTTAPAPEVVEGFGSEATSSGIKVKRPKTEKQIQAIERARVSRYLY